jgi:hypothetical protein
VAGYDQEVLNAIYARANQVDDPSKRNRYLRAALQTGLVESGLRNLDYGDADSQGWRQERASLYPDPTNIQASVDRFFTEAQQHDRGQHSWELAADVQRPREDLRGRYKDVARQAAALLGQGGGASSPRPMGNTDPAGGATAPPAPSFDPGPATDYSAALAQLLGQDQQQAPQSSPIQAPSRVALPQGFREIAPSGGPQQEQGASAALSLLETLRGSDPGTGTSGLVGAADRPQIAEKVFKDREAGRGAANVTSRTGEVVVAPNANREGVDLDPAVLDFVGRVAGIYGQPLTIGTGSNHSQYTVSGNVSNHWDGRGADIPASGKELTRMGQDALIAAGMPERQARKVRGGLFNLGGVQIIFQTNGPDVGDHTDHLHVGLRG